MSHTYKASEGTVFIHDSNVLKSDVIIKSPDGSSVTVSGADLIEFIGVRHVKARKMRELENKSGIEILGYD